MNAMGDKIITGSCACGDITYTSTAPHEHLDYCYCLTCQQMSGAPFMAWIGIPKDSLKWEFKSKPILYHPTVGDAGVTISDRTCCSKCGCNILLQYYLCPHKSHVAASTIKRNDFDNIQVGCHIWCRQAPIWHTIADDGIERYDEFDKDFKARLDRYMNSEKT